MFFMDDFTHPSIICLLSAAASRGVFNRIGFANKKRITHSNGTILALFTAARIKTNTATRRQRGSIFFKLSFLNSNLFNNIPGQQWRKGLWR
jgi:hypothetical protein